MKVSSICRRECLCCLFLLVHCRAFPQNQIRQSPSFSLGYDAYYGFKLKHIEAIGAIARGHCYGGEVYGERIRTGQQYWEKAYRYPRTGLALGYFDLANSRVGKTVYLIHYLEKPLRKGKRSEVNLKFGLGAVYCTRPFNLENNYQNVAISSRFSYALRGALGYTCALSDNLTAKTGLVLTHFSNGSIKMPNSGLNLLMMQLGLRYTPRAAEIVYHAEVPAPPPAKDWSVQASVAFTAKKMGLPGGRTHPGLVLMVHLSRRLSYKSALNIGLDGTYNTALREEINQDPTINPANRPDFKRVALALGHELYISRHVSMLTQVGVYGYRRYRSNVDAPFYQRYGLRYYPGAGMPSQRIFGGMNLKAHFGTADFVEWTVGVCF